MTSSLIAQARRKAGLTQAQLAEKVGVAQQHIARWESGARKPKLDALIKIAAALNIPLESLIS